jgi:ethanolamine utilization protein EutS
MSENISAKQRVIQEYVPGKQLTLAHIIASPDKMIYQNLGLDDEDGDSLGILTITPGEAVIIAADVATKAADVGIGFLDRFGGALVLSGDVASVTSAVQAVTDMFENVLQFSTVKITRT